METYRTASYLKLITLYNLVHTEHKQIIESYNFYWTPVISKYFFIETISPCFQGLPSLPTPVPLPYLQDNQGHYLKPDLSGGLGTTHTVWPFSGQNDIPCWDRSTLHIMDSPGPNRTLWGGLPSVCVQLTSLLNIFVSWSLGILCAGDRCSEF